MVSVEGRSIISSLGGLTILDRVRQAQIAGRPDSQAARRPNSRTAKQLGISVVRRPGGPAVRQVLHVR